MRVVLTPTDEAEQMIKFISVMNKGDDTWCFINTDGIAKVTCKVTTTRTGGGFDIRSTVDPSLPKSTPVQEKTDFTITLHTASGDGEMIFDTEGEANTWAETNLGISDIVGNTQTKDY